MESSSNGPNNPSPGKKLRSLQKVLHQSSTNSNSSSKKLTTPLSIKNPFGTTEETRISHGKNVYQIGTEIGRGAFGVVYQAFNVDTGDFVAVKRFPIKSIEDDQLAAIESEIELMQKLNHSNIVHYVRTIRSKNFLYIVLEYMENGSLSAVIKKFGAFSESLTAIYVSQVLNGLSYLHEQGVLHRDIKGANILTTKDGQVKLADFGVAVRLCEGSMVDGLEVVGSPYWIAPEVIEMNTPTAACDIWSVGCLVIELLTGRPPYHDLAPLPAMFHIVQDDHPPFPKGISEVVKDFLLLCFNKDPSLRPSARNLLMHPWLQNPSSVSNLQESELEESVSGLESSVANTIRMFRKTATTKVPEIDIMLANASTNSVVTSVESDEYSNLSPTDNKQSQQQYQNHQHHHQQQPSSSLSSSMSKEENGRPPIAPSNSTSSIHNGTNNGSNNSDNANINNSNAITKRNLWVSTGNRSPVYPSTRSKYYNFPLDSPINGNGNYFDFGADIDMNASMDNLNILSPRSSNLSSARSDYKLVEPLSSKKHLSLTHPSQIYQINRKDSDGNKNNHVSNSTRSNSGINTSDHNSKNYDSDIKYVELTTDLSSEENSQDGNSPEENNPNRSHSHNHSYNHSHSQNQLQSKNTRVPSLQLPQSRSEYLSDGFYETKNQSSSDAKSAININIDNYKDNDRDPSLAIQVLQRNSSDDNNHDIKKLSTSSPHIETRQLSKSMTMDNSNSSSMSTPSSYLYERKDNSFSEISSIVSPRTSLLRSAQRSTSRLSSARSFSNSRAKSEKNLLSRPLGTPRGKGKVVIPKTTPFFTIRSTSNASSTRSDSRPRSNMSSGTSDNNNNNNNNSNNNSSNNNRVKFRHGTIDSSRSSLSRDNSNNSVGKQDSTIREAKELFRVIHSMKPNTPEINLGVLCDQLWILIENNPELAIQLVNIYGLSSILDLMESKESGMVSVNLRYPTLRLLNKIMENNQKVQEQVAFVGMIPKVIHLVEVSCANELKASYSTSISAASESITASLGVLWPGAFPPSPPSFDSLVLEAAQFLYLMASSSNTTIQSLITAGGLNVIVDMISIGSLIIQPNPMKSFLSSSFISSSNRLSASRTIDLFRCRTNGISEKLIGVVDNNTIKPSNHPFRFSISLDSSEPVISEEAKQITYLGIDSLIKVCREPSSLKKEYCRIFIKYNLLNHLAGTFFNILTLYHRSFVNLLSSPKTTQSSRQNSVQTSEHSISSQDKNVEEDQQIEIEIKSPGRKSPPKPYEWKSNDADKTQECKYAFAIANIIYNYSKFDINVAETMSKYEPGGILWVILVFLSSPELRAAPLTVVSSTTNNTGSTFSYFDTTTSYVPSMQSRLSIKDFDTDVSFSGIAGVIGLGGIGGISGRRRSQDTLYENLTSTTIVLSKPYMEIILLLIRTLKNLSAEPSTLFNLEKGGTIPILVQLLNGPISEKCKNQVIACIYNLCRVNKRRQEQAAVHGIIPYLQVISKGGDNRTRQYALPLLCSLAHASSVSRSELRKNDGVNYFLGLLKENFWQTYAFNALVTWISHDVDYVQGILIEHENMMKLIEFFCMASPQTFRSINQPIVDMMLKSSTLCRALGISSLFIQSLIRRLTVSDAMILCSVLRMIQLLHQYHVSSRQFIIDHNLIQIVKKFTQSEGQVLVYQMASKLLSDFQMSSMT